MIANSSLEYLHHRVFGQVLHEYWEHNASLLMIFNKDMQIWKYIGWPVLVIHALGYCKLEEI